MRKSQVRAQKNESGDKKQETAEEGSQAFGVEFGGVACAERSGSESEQGKRKGCREVCSGSLRVA